MHSGRSGLLGNLNEFPNKLRNTVDSKYSRLSLIRFSRGIKFYRTRESIELRSVELESRLYPLCENSPDRPE